VFSPADYELAARLTGLPVPRTPAEMAAAAPVVNLVLKQFARGDAPMPGMEDPDMMSTSRTRSLNPYPQNNQPELKNQLQRKLMAGVVDPEDETDIAMLAQEIQESPECVEILLELLEYLQQMGDEGADYLSSQQPTVYDKPQQGGGYSMLNAPASSMIPPSIGFDELN